MWPHANLLALRTQTGRRYHRRQGTGSKQAIALSLRAVRDTVPFIIQNWHRADSARELAGRRSTVVKLMGRSALELVRRKRGHVRVPAALVLTCAGRYLWWKRSQVRPCIKHTHTCRRLAHQALCLSPQLVVASELCGQGCTAVQAHLLLTRD